MPSTFEATATVARKAEKMGLDGLVLANICRDLQANSGGRFMLGLGHPGQGTQPAALECQMGSPGEALREVVLSLRAIWDCWQNGTVLNFAG